VLRGRLPRTAVLNLTRCVDTIQEQLAMPFDHLGDAKTFNNVGSDPDDTH
jgi:hypothetical protein